MLCELLGKRGFVYKQKKYLDNQPLAEAIGKYDDALKAANIGKPLTGERVLVGDALGRVTSEAVIAKISSPFYHSAAMDETGSTT